MKAKTETISVGAKVRIVPQHWLRGYQQAVIIGFRPGAQNNWLVEFESTYAGGGIEGNKLWLDERYFSEVGQEEPATVDVTTLQPQYPRQNNLASSRHSTSGGVAISSRV